MKTKEKQGITLIALVITVIVLLILAGVSIAVLTGDNGTITKAVESKFKTELAEAREEFEIYVTRKYSENSRFEEGTLNAGKGFLTYNTMPEGETGNIYDVLKNTPKKYAKCFEIIKGELIYANTNKRQLEWALELGMKINPYLIDEEGTLLSSNTNLMLMDENTGTVVLPESVKKIANGAFRDVPGIRTIIIPGTVKEIGEHAFSGNPTLENIIIEEGLEKIGSYAFKGCQALKEVHIANTVNYIGEECFNECIKLEKINIPTSLKTINVHALANCYELTEIEIPEGIQIIDEYAFRNNEKLQKVIIPSTVTVIRGTAFSGAHNLKNIEISSKNNSYSFNDSSLMSRDGKTLYYVIFNSNEIVIPDTVETIDNGALNNFPENLKLTISKNVKNIYSKFSSMITSITVAEENLYFKSVDGNLYNKDMTVLYRYAKNENSFVVPNTVKNIKSNAFQDKKNLVQLTLQEGLEKIDGWNFQNTKISNLYIPSTVTSISPEAFALANTNVTISEQNKTYKTEDGTMILSKDGKILYLISKELQKYQIPDSVEIIGTEAFYYRTTAKEIIMPPNIREIKNIAFFEVLQLQKIEIPASIEKIDSTAFRDCNRLKEIIIHKSKLQDGSDPIPGAPWGCPNTREIVIWKE